jgi:small conductance mechanosensitive channel
VFGFNLTGLLVGAGFLGIVIGLAAQQVLGNVLAGISIFVSRPFEIGDRVTIVNSSYGLMGSSYSHETEINGITGTIRDIGIFFTRVQLDEGPPSSFPNSQITQSLIISHTHTTLRRIRVRIDIDKRVAFKEFRSRLSQALSRHDEIDPTMSKVRIVDIGGDTYQVAIEVWSHSPDDEPIKTIVLQEALEVQSQLAPESSVAKSPSAESLEGAPVKPSQAPNTNA